MWYNVITGYMGTMMRRIPGSASWHVFKDGTPVGKVTQAADGSWMVESEGDIVSQPQQVATRKDGARLLAGL